MINSSGRNSSFLYKTPLVSLVMMWSLLDAAFILSHADLPMKSIRYSDSFYVFSDSCYLELSLY